MLDKAKFQGKNHMGEHSLKPELKEIDLSRSTDLLSYWDTKGN